MDTTHFGTIARVLAESTSRRQALGGVIAAAAALAGGSVIGNGVVEARRGGRGKGKKRGNEKVTLCKNGHTIRVGRPSVPAHLKKGATVGRC